MQTKRTFSAGFFMVSGAVPKCIPRTGGGQGSSRGAGWPFPPGHPWALAAKTRTRGSEAPGPRIISALDALPLLLREVLLHQLLQAHSGTELGLGEPVA